MRLTNSIILCIILLGSNCQLIAKTLDDVIKRGHLLCGVSQSLPGFSFPGDDGTWSGLDVDVCRAVAAAVLHDGTKVRFIPLSTKERFTALQSGEIDILSRNTTWSFSRDAGQGFEFTNIVYYDGQGFMVRKSTNITDPRQLNNVTICTNSGTTSELNLADYFRKNNLQNRVITFEKDTEVITAYNAGRCDAYSSDRSGLAAQRLKLSNPEANIILPQVISKEPLGPLVRQDDMEWADIVRWTIFGLVNAEEAGITQNNVDALITSQDPNIQRILGVGQNFGKLLGLSADFMVYVIRTTGNYAEIFERNIGVNSKLKLERGLNNLWSQGGIMYAPPFR